MEFVKALRHTDRWTGRMTDNRDANVARDTPSQTPLWLLSRSLVPTSIKSGSFATYFWFPAMTEIATPTPDPLLSGNVHKTPGQKDVLRPFFFCFRVFFVISYWCCCLNQSLSLSAFLFRKLASNDLVGVAVSSGPARWWVRGDLWEDSDWRLLRGGGFGGWYQTWLEYGLS